MCQEAFYWYTIPMNKKRPIYLLFVAILSLISLLYLMIYHTPSSLFTVPSTFVSFPTLYLFFFLFIIFTFSCVSFLFKNIKRGILVSVFLTLYIVLRISGFTQAYFALIIIALYVTLELLIHKRQ